jgi:hypothetical protein
VDKHTDILYRLARFLAGVPPEAPMMLLVLALHPWVFVGPLFWLLDGVVNQIVLSFLTLMFVLYVWPMLPLGLRRAVLRIIAAFLPGRVLHHLGIIPDNEPNVEVPMDSLDRTQIPMTWINTRVELELHVISSDPEDVEKRYGTLSDMNNVGAVVEETFYPWTSIKAMTHQPDTFNNMTDEELDEALAEGDEEPS